MHLCVGVCVWVGGWVGVVGVMCVCVCARARARVRPCVHACVLSVVHVSGFFVCPSLCVTPSLCLSPVSPISSRAYITAAYDVV